MDVRGKCFFSQNVGIGAQPDADIQLLTSTTNVVGYCVDHNYAGGDGYAYKAIMHNDLTKGIGLYSSVHNKDMFTVYGDGKMVIENATGTTLQLEANGLLRARQIKVDVDAWPDFVFEDDYELKSLSEIKDYINITD